MAATESGSEYSAAKALEKDTAEPLPPTVQPVVLQLAHQPIANAK
jgi:hypothetical protein